MCDPDVARYVLRHPDALSKEKLIELLLKRYASYSPQYLQNLLDHLKVEWVNKFQRFRIDLNHGYETVVYG